MILIPLWSSECLATTVGVGGIAQATHFVIKASL